LHGDTKVHFEILQDQYNETLQLNDKNVEPQKVFEAL
jgi:hypothetical protein